MNVAIVIRLSCPRVVGHGQTVTCHGLTVTCHGLTVTCTAGASAVTVRSILESSPIPGEYNVMKPLRPNASWGNFSCASAL